jgi:hypothetical protein
MFLKFLFVFFFFFFFFFFFLFFFDIMMMLFLEDAVLLGWGVGLDGPCDVALVAKQAAHFCSNWRTASRSFRMEKCASLALESDSVSS